MKKIGILQPGRLGDIIICLPIAKHYHDLGYEVVWPVFHNFVDMVQSRVDYVKFLPVTNNVYTTISESINLLSGLDDIKILDIAATFPGSSCTEEYVVLGDGMGEEKFDEFKYRKCGVPISKKWCLEFNRDFEEEEKLYAKYVTSPNYIVVGLKHSRGQANIKIETNKLVVELNENHNIFNWIKILENANSIVLVDSAMANLVEQLNLPNKKILITKPGQPLPKHRNTWIYK